MPDIKEQILIYLPDLLMIVIGVAIISAGLYLIQKYWKYVIRVKFCREYGLNELPKCFKLMRKWTGKSYFILKFPHWKYANKDGTMDKRRNGNRVIREYSSLFLKKYEVRAWYPSEIVQLVYKLRMHGADIELHRLEMAKQSRLLSERRKKQQMDSIESLIARFSDSPYEFETFCAQLYQSLGFFAETTARSNDGGYDLIIRDNAGRMSIAECKCYAAGNLVGRPLLQKLAGANQVVDAQHLIFITTSGYTKAAIAYAEEIGMNLIDGNRILAMMEESKAGEKRKKEKVNWYLKPEDLLEYIPDDIEKY